MLDRTGDVAIKEWENKILNGEMEVPQTKEELGDYTNK